MHGPEVLVAAAVDAQRHEAVAVVELLLRPVLVVDVVVEMVALVLLLLLLLHPLSLERGAARPLADEARPEPSVLLDDI